MEPIAVLEQAREVSLTVWVDGSELRVKGQPTLQALAVVETLKVQKAEVVTFLRRYGDSQPLPWTGLRPQSKNCGDS